MVPVLYIFNIFRTYFYSLLYAKNRHPNGYLLFWYSEANQIRTVLRLSKSGFYVVKCDGFRTILVVECDDQLIIVEIDPVDKSVDEPLPVGLFAHIQNPELV